MPTTPAAGQRNDYSWQFLTCFGWQCLQPSTKMVPAELACEDTKPESSRTSSQSLSNRAVQERERAQGATAVKAAVLDLNDAQLGPDDNQEQTQEGGQRVGVCGDAEPDNEADNHSKVICIRDYAHPTHPTT
eukprot:scaffold33508_cov42-Prasinocladus_malaysianus.AAC.1